MNYLLHFERPFKHAKHYLGFTTSLSARLDHHFAGRGSRLMAAVAAAGIRVAVAHIWPDNDRNDERRLKNQKNSARYCPICQGTKAFKDCPNR